MNISVLHIELITEGGLPLKKTIESMEFVQRGGRSQTQNTKNVGVDSGSAEIKFWAVLGD